MSDYEILIVILTIGILIVSIITLCLTAKKRAAITTNDYGSIKA